MLPPGDRIWQQISPQFSPNAISGWIGTIDSEINKNRLLKVCYVPTPSAASSKVFLLWPITVITRQTKQAVCTIKQSISLDVYDWNPQT
jgi:hypothetical protein